VKWGLVLLATVVAALGGFAIYTFGWHESHEASPAPTDQQTLMASRLETLRAVRLIGSTSGGIAENLTAPKMIQPYLPGRWIVEYPRPEGISGSFCMLIEPKKFHATHSRSGYEFVPCEIRP